MRAKSTLSMLALLLATCPCLAQQAAQTRATSFDDRPVPVVLSSQPAKTRAKARTAPRGDGNSSLRVIFGWANSRNNNHATKIIGGLGIGGYLGDPVRHEINMDFLLSAWQTRFYDSSGNLRSKYSQMHVPLLLNYGYHIALPRIPCAFHVGGGMGIDFIETTFTPIGQNDLWNQNGIGTGRSVSFASAANAGFVVRLSSRFSLDFSYRCMWQSASRYVYTNSNTNNSPSQPSPTPSVSLRARSDIVNMILFNAGFWF